MRREEATRILQSHANELKQEYGVRSLDIFGSVARDEANGTSDVDLLVEFDRPVGYFELFALESRLQSLLDGVRVDLVLRNAVIEELQPIIYREALHVV